MSGGFTTLTQPASGIAPGTRFEALHGGRTISLGADAGVLRRPRRRGLAQTAGERSLGAALDATRPAPGVTMDPVRAALFGPLYTLPAGSIAAGPR